MYHPGMGAASETYQGLVHQSEVQKSWEEGYNPLEEHFYNARFNSYVRGPGANLPFFQQPYNRQLRDSSMPYRLFVGNIDPLITENAMLHIFSSYGKPLKIERKRNKYSNDIMAFVEFATQREADAAISGLHEKHPLYWFVSYARERAVPNPNAEVLDLSRLTVGGSQSAPAGPLSSRTNSAFSRYPEQTLVPYSANEPTDYPPCVRCNFPAPYACQYCVARYCSKSCQHRDWPLHKAQCQLPPPLVAAGPQGQVAAKREKAESPRIVELTPMSPSPVSGQNPRFEASSLSRANKNLHDLQSRLTLPNQSNQREAFNEDSRATPLQNPPIPNDKSSGIVLAPTGIKPLDNYRAGQSNDIEISLDRRSGLVHVKGSSPKTRQSQQDRPSESHLMNERFACQPSNQKTSAFPSLSQSSGNSIPKRPASTQPAKFAKTIPAPEIDENVFKTDPVVVCFSKSPDKFYVQLKKSLQPLDQLTKQIAETASKAPVVAIPTEGLPCLAVFEGIWYRAVVLKLFDSGVGVRYVDYGNTARISNSVANLRMMDEALSQLPSFAIQVRLANVVPIEGTDWPTDVCARFNSYVENAAFHLDCVGRDSQGLVVNMKRVGDNVDVAHYLIANNMAKLATNSRNLPANPTSPRPPVTCLPRSSPKRAVVSDAPVSSSLFDQLAAGEVVDYMVGVPFDPINLISVGSVFRDDDLVDIVAFHQFCLEASSRNRPKQPPVVGSVVAAFSPQLRQWFRACILSSDPEGYRVLYVDFGNEEVVVNVQPIPDGFHRPYLAIRFKMVGSVERWIEEYATRSLTLESQHKLRIVHRNQDGSLSGELKDPANTKTICKVRIESWKSLIAPKDVPGNATPISSPSKMRPISPAKSERSPVPKPVCDSSAAAVKPAPQPKINTPLVPKPADIPKEQPAMNSPRKLVHDKPVPLKTDQAAVPKAMESVVDVPVRKIPRRPWKVDSLNQVLISSASDLDSIWVQYFSNDVIRVVDLLLTTLNQVCPTLKVPEQMPPVDSYVAAMFPDDGLFYRALIKSISGSMANVLYIDYGNSATVGLDLIRPLPDDLFEHQILSTRVILAGLPTSYDHKEPSVCEFLEKMVNEMCDLRVVATCGDAIEAVVYCNQQAVNDQIRALLDQNGPPTTQPAVSDQEAVPQLVLVEPTPRTDLPDDKVVTSYYDDGPFIDLPEKGRCRVVILSASTPQSIHVRLDDDSLQEKIEKLQRDMTAYAAGLVIGYAPSVSEICMVRRMGPDSECWYRAACLEMEEINDIKRYYVILVDSGDMFRTEVSEIRRIPKRFIDFVPYVAQQAILKEVEHLNELDPKVEARVAQLLPIGSKLDVEIVGRNGAAYVVDIPAVSDVLRSENLI